MRESDHVKMKGVVHVAMSDALKRRNIDRIYKIYRIRRKKIDPVNLVNPVYVSQELSCRAIMP